ncbi:unnamed protein product [Bubo scandiacus]
MERFKGNLETGGYVLALTVLILGELTPSGMWKTAVTSIANLEEVKAFHCLVKGFSSPIDSSLLSYSLSFGNQSIGTISND